jgi:hypothetical protein
MADYEVQFSTDLLVGAAQTFGNPGAPPRSCLHGAEQRFYRVLVNP